MKHLKCAIKTNDMFYHCCFWTECFANIKLIHQHTSNSFWFDIYASLLLHYCILQVRPIAWIYSFLCKDNNFNKLRCNTQQTLDNHIKRILQSKQKSKTKNILITVLLNKEILNNIIHTNTNTRTKMINNLYVFWNVIQVYYFNTNPL